MELFGKWQKDKHFWYQCMNSLDDFKASETKAPLSKKMCHGFYKCKWEQFTQNDWMMVVEQSMMKPFTQRVKLTERGKRYCKIVTDNDFNLGSYCGEYAVFKYSPDKLCPNHLYEKCHHYFGCSESSDSTHLSLNSDIK